MLPIKRLLALTRTFQRSNFLRPRGARRGLLSGTPNTPVSVRRANDLEVLNIALYNIQRMLENRDFSGAYDFADMHLETRTFGIASGQAYEAIVNLLYEHHCGEYVVDLYAKMLRCGHVPSDKLRARMELLAILRPGTSTRELSEFFQRVRIETREFLQALDIIRSFKNICPATLRRFLRAYVDATSGGKAPHAKISAAIVYLSVLDGRTADALAWLERIHAALPREPKRPPSSLPYNAFITALSQCRPNDHRAFDAILSTSRAHGIAIDARLLEALIVREASRKRLHRAYALYTRQMVKPTPGTLPTARAFAALFEATMRTSFMYINHSTRNACPPRNAVPARTLYMGMTTCHRAKSRLRIISSPSASPAALDAALGAFMVQRDYAAAFVVLKTFGMFGLAPTAQTYLVVLSHLVWRAKRDVRERMRDTGEGAAQRHWVGRMFGLQGDGAAWRERSDVQWLSRLWMLAQLQNLTEIPPSSTGPGSGKSGSTSDTSTHTPSRVALRLRARLFGQTLRLDLVPLQRLLRRAMVAEPTTEQGYAKSGTAGMQASEAIKRAKMEMVAPKWMIKPLSRRDVQGVGRVQMGPGLLIPRTRYRFLERSRMSLHMDEVLGRTKQAPSDNTT